MHDKPVTQEFLERRMKTGFPFTVYFVQEEKRDRTKREAHDNVDDVVDGESWTERRNGRPQDKTGPYKGHSRQVTCGGAERIDQFLEYKSSALRYRFIVHGAAH
jgi:hypothetical protein